MKITDRGEARGGPVQPNTVKLRGVASWERQVPGRAGADVMCALRNSPVLRRGRRMPVGAPRTCPGWRAACEASSALS